jgi:hypothetical protein
MRYTGGMSERFQGTSNCQDPNAITISAAAEPENPGTVYVEIDDSDIGEIAGIWLDDATAERMVAAVQNAIEDSHRARAR